MIKIRSFKKGDIKAIEELISKFEPSIVPRFAVDFKYPNYWLNLLHNILPLNFQFTQKTYIAVKDKQPIGLIGLIPDGKNNRRWKINQLLLATSLYDVGGALVDYVVNKYGSEGVETFIAEINKENAEAITLLKNSCGFRSCTTVHIYNFNGEASNFTPKKVILPELRPVNPWDADKLYVLNLEALKPEVKISLEKSHRDFIFGVNTKFADTSQGFKVKRLVLEIPYTNNFAAYIYLKTKDSLNYQIGLVANLAYQAYYEDLLHYLMHEILSTNKNSKVVITVPECIQSSNQLISVVEDVGFKLCQTNQLLVKDYWKAIKDPLLKVPIIMLSDGSAVCNN